MKRVYGFRFCIKNNGNDNKNTHSLTINLKTYYYDQKNSCLVSYRSGSFWFYSLRQLPMSLDYQYITSSSGNIWLI